MNSLRPRRRNRMSWTIGVLLVALTATVVLADPMIWSGMTLDAYHVLGNTVGLTLTNSGSTAFGGYVVVRAVVNDTPVWSVAPLSARPGQTVNAAVSFPGNVQSVTSVQVTDDLNSF